MAKPKFDSDGFQIVTSKNFSKNKSTKIPSHNVNFKKDEVVIDTGKVLKRINATVEDLRVSTFLEEVSKSVSTTLKFGKVVEIICLGLGHIGECNISQYQLGFLLCLKEQLGVKKTLVHDPIFYISECEVLTKLGLEIIEQNNEGNYIISDKDITLVFLPHCPTQLTNNFLWSNWGPKLQNCVIICNSFTSLIENQPSRLLAETIPYIYKIFPNTCEVPLENNFKYTDIFNDTSIHYFPIEKLVLLDTDFWKKGSKPQYDNSEEFITSLMIEKLSI